MGPLRRLMLDARPHCERSSFLFYGLPCDRTPPDNNQHLNQWPEPSTVRDITAAIQLNRYRLIQVD
jgi:hypothetical protein